jgi:hypothetical protein
MHSLLQDVPTFKLMRKRVEMTTLLLSALVVGIGVNSEVFSLVAAG